jgi:hypothetical protein
MSSGLILEAAWVEYPLHLSCAFGELVIRHTGAQSVSGISRAHRSRARQTPAPDLIAKEKHRQAEQECARQGEKKQLRYIKHFEMTPMPKRILPAW